MRHFELEKYFSKWEFTAHYHMTASDTESLSVNDVLNLAGEQTRQNFQNHWLGYTETWGAPGLREEIAKTYDSMAKENILCFCGANEGIYATMRVLLSRQDHVITIVPNYQSSETIPLEICQVSGVLLHESNDWRIDLDELESAIRPTTKLVAINFPNNPTGAVLPADDLDTLINICRKYGLYLFSDEVYRSIELDDADRMDQVADRYEKGISLNVMSKAYGLPGLRVGWIACRDITFLQQLERYKHYLSICNSATSEYLSLVALQNREQILARNRALVRRNILELDDFFNQHADLFKWVRPKGGCVGFVNYSGSDGVEEFCRSLVEQHGILLLPSSIYRSELLPFETNHFRIGFGRDRIFQQGMAALKQSMTV